MNEIVSELTKPVWWVSVVVAGIVINLLSAYLKSPLDTVAAKTFSWWRNRSEAKKADWRARVERIRQDDRVRNSELAREIRFRLQSIHLLLLAIFVLVIPSFVMASGAEAPKLIRVGTLGFSSLIFFASFLAFLEAANTASALKEVSKKSDSSINTDVTR